MSHFRFAYSCPIHRNALITLDTAYAETLPDGTWRWTGMQCGLCKADENAKSYTFTAGSTIAPVDASRVYARQEETFGATPLDLDAIEARAKAVSDNAEWYVVSEICDTQLALVAEVRRLQALVGQGATARGSSSAEPEEGKVYLFLGVDNPQWGVFVDGALFHTFADHEIKHTRAGVQVHMSAELTAKLPVGASVEVGPVAS